MPLIRYCHNESKCDQQFLKATVIHTIDRHEQKYFFQIRLPNLVYSTQANTAFQCKMDDVVHFTINENSIFRTYRCYTII